MDTTDNIKGIPKHGKKYAQDLLANNEMIKYPGLILNQYERVFGSYKGVEEFYKNYKLLKIVDNIYENEEIPKLREVNNLTS